MKEGLQKAVDAFKKTSFCPAGAEYDESCGLFKVDGVFDITTQRFWEAFNLGRHVGGIDAPQNDFDLVAGLLVTDLPEDEIKRRLACFQKKPHSL